MFFTFTPVRKKPKLHLRPDASVGEVVVGIAVLVVATVAINRIQRVMAMR